MASVSTLSFLKSRLYAKSTLSNENLHFGHTISYLKSRLFVKLRFVKSRLYCIWWLVWYFFHHGLSALCMCSSLNKMRNMMIVVLSPETFHCCKHIFLTFPLLYFPLPEIEIIFQGWVTTVGTEMGFCFSPKWWKSSTFLSSLFAFLCFFSCSVALQVVRAVGIVLVVLDTTFNFIKFFKSLRHWTLDLQFHNTWGAPLIGVSAKKWYPLYSEVWW